MGNREEDYYKRRLAELENRLEELRLSRRVLLGLVEKLEKEKKEAIARLEVEKEHLKKENARYARALLEKNSEIVRLTSRKQA